MNRDSDIPSRIAATADAEAVAAVRMGDVDRFRDLVERHADRVFAVAWCRLGNRSLAEDAAQETFITAFQRLGLLGKAEHFGAWITTIARRTSINLGVRQLHELRRRERWAVHAVSDSAPDACPDSATPQLDLEATLQSLPPIYRECLALFYLERQSVSAASASLGISESTFKVRLHRARHAMRDRVSQHVEGTLADLRAPTHLSQTVMLALPATSAPLGTLGVFVSGIWKSLPLWFSLFTIQTILLLPAFLLALGLGRLEANNFNEGDQFRRIAYRQMSLRNLVGFAAGTGVVALMSASLPLRGFAGLGAGLILLHVGNLIRRFTVTREWTPVVMAISFALIAIPMIALAIGNPPAWIFSLGLGLFFVLWAWILPRQAPRMDYSLFARAAMNLLPAVPEPPGSLPTSPLKISQAEARGFAAFLGRNRLLEDGYWNGFTLVLCVPGITALPAQSLLPGRWSPGSRLRLLPTGTVSACVGSSDARELARHWAAAPGDLPRLESAVASNVTQAWRAFRNGDPDRARALLGCVPESKVFRRPHARSYAVWIRTAVLCAGAIRMFLDCYWIVIGPG